MKKLIVIGLIAMAPISAFSGGVNVDTVAEGTTHYPCDGASGGGIAKISGGSGEVISPGVFTKAGFNVICSSNVHLGFVEVSPTVAVVGAGSAKGNQYFGGNSNGGAINAIGKCTGTNDACGTGDVDTAITSSTPASTETSSGG
jgi:hypothetical protein